MKTKHTPGPWVIGQSFSGRTLINGPTGGSVAQPISQFSGSLTAEDRANARLIAAAPDMLEALEACHAVLWNGYDKDSQAWLDARAKALSAIAKATGGGK